MSDNQGTTLRNQERSENHGTMLRNYEKKCQIVQVQL